MRWTVGTSESPLTITFCTVRTSYPLSLPPPAMWTCPSCSVTGTLRSAMTRRVPSTFRLVPPLPATATPSLWMEAPSPSPRRALTFSPGLWRTVWWWYKPRRRIKSSWFWTTLTSLAPPPLPYIFPLPTRCFSPPLRTLTTPWQMAAPTWPLTTTTSTV